MLYQINKGTKYYGANLIFEDIQFEIKNTEKIAIVGRNGCGKTTLLRVMMQEEEMEKGTIHKLNGIQIGYLSQHTFSNDEKTVEEELNEAFSLVFALQSRLEELEQQMVHNHTEEILNAYADVQHQFEELNGYQYKQEMMTVFTKFGFSEEDLPRAIGTFSGGQKTKIAFVKLLLSKPDILLLDEPTNHLDLKTIEWLEGYLKYYNKAVVLVSHDRMFLDKVVDVIYEIELTKMSRYVGNYTNFVNAKALLLEKQADAYVRQQKDIERLEALIEKFRYKKNKAAFAQSKIKYLDRMDKIELSKTDEKTFKAHFTPAKKGGKQVLSLQNYTVGYSNPLCSVTLDILQGQRIAIIGPNGKGKSTLVKSIMDLVPSLGGQLLWGHQIETGYFDQQLAQFNTTKTVLEELWDDYPDLDRTTIRTTLGTFLFSSDDVFKTVDVLSGGEKVRLSFAKLLLKKANFLILDEPTNHLDILGKEALEDSLMEYNGTLLFVSHDRYFINKLATSLLIIDEGKAEYLQLTYQEYLDKQNGIQKVEKIVQKQVSEAKIESKVIRKSKKEIERLEKTIQEKENTLEELREKRFDPEYYHDFKKMAELDEEIDGLHNEIHDLMLKWEEYYQ